MIRTNFIIGTFKSRRNFFKNRFDEPAKIQDISMTEQSGISIKPIMGNDRPWIHQLLTEQWGSNLIVVTQRIIDAAQLPGFIALQAQARIGLITYISSDSICEIITLNSLQQNIGAGTGLLDKLRLTAHGQQCTALSVITTNDNLNALRFYQKYGFHLHALYPNAVQSSRLMKPSIPETGENGIPIRDEIELRLML